MKINLVKKIKGFTLIEILVVVLIIGILAAIAVPQYQKAVLKSRYTQLITVANNLAHDEELYFMANGSFTKKLNNLDSQLPVGAELTSQSKAILSDFIWTIWIASNGSYGAIESYYKSNLKYVQYFPQGYISSGDRECRAKKDDSLANDVCKSLGGKRYSHFDGYEAYVLP